MTSSWVCPNCGHLGAPVRITKGSIGIEILLWLFFLVPGVLYSIWRLASRYDGCSICKAANMIPADSPRGAMLTGRSS